MKKPDWSPRQDLNLKVTQAAREAQNLPPGPERIEAMKKADGLRHAADQIDGLVEAYKLAVNSNGQIKRNFRRQPPRGRSHFVMRIVVAAFSL